MNDNVDEWMYVHVCCPPVTNSIIMRWYFQDLYFMHRGLVVGVWWAIIDTIVMVSKKHYDAYWTEEEIHYLPVKKLIEFTRSGIGSNTEFQNME